MGLVAFDLPAIAPEDYHALSFRDRIRFMAVRWVEDGFGTPRLYHLIYIVKLAVFYAGGGFVAVWLTSDVGPLTDLRSWWAEPIVYQKLVLWTMLLETIGVAGTWGPLAGHFKPFTGAIRYWVRPGTIRVAPWPGKVPLTAGHRRTVVDVVLYVAMLASIATALVLPGVADAELSRVLPDATGGLVRPELLWPIIAITIVLGLRDKVAFLAARAEQYLPALFFGATLGVVDMIIAFKVLIVVVWVGAGVSKLNEHFVNVVPPMVANSPFIPSKWFKRAHVRSFPDDLRPSRLAWFMAHVGGTTVEIVLPLILLVTTNKWVGIGAAVCMIVFHLFITSTFPLAVPLEWNIMFVYITAFGFLAHRADLGFGLADFSEPWLLVAIGAALCFFPVLGNFRPDLVSFLPSMRQYAGNWATAEWAFAPGAEAKLDQVYKPCDNQIDQLIARGFEPETAEMIIQGGLAWRAMHSQGRGLNSLLLRHLPDLDRRSVRDGEWVCNTVLGWNFGDGHLHDERLITAIQEQVGFAPGELLIVICESQPIHKKTQEWRVIDAALGEVERGTWLVDDAVHEQPWLPNGPIPLHVTWTRPDCTPSGLTSGATP